MTVHGQVVLGRAPVASLVHVSVQDLAVLLLERFLGGLHLAL